MSTRKTPVLEPFHEELDRLIPEGSSLRARAPEIEAALEESLRGGEAAAPDVTADAALFGRQLARSVVSTSAATVVDALGALAVADLYVACACGQGDARALAWIERAIMSKARAYVGHIDSSPAFVDEVVQQLREKLFVATERPPGVLEYRGRGSLESWVRIAAVRLALNLKRSDKRANVGASRDSDATEVAAPGPDPELQMVRALHREHFRDAFHATLGELSSDERAVLRMHYLDGLTIDEICLGYRVHRSTVARWIERARQRVLSETLRRMKASRAADSREVDSTMRFFESQFDVTVQGLLDGND